MIGIKFPFDSSIDTLKRSQSAVCRVLLLIKPNTLTGIALYFILVPESLKIMSKM